MGGPRGRYSEKELARTLTRVREGDSYAHVARTSPIPLRTLFAKAKAARVSEKGDSMVQLVVKPTRRGPKPVLPAFMETDLVDWIAAMQRVGLPQGSTGILRKAKELYQLLGPYRTRSVGKSHLTSGWYYRFRDRHPLLTTRMAQPISRVRNTVTGHGVWILFGTMTKLVIEHKLTAARFFNMDETSFMPTKKTKTVVAIKGSTNVWSNECKANFHMTVCAAVSAAGTALPPLIIVPGVRILKTDLAAATIERTCVTGAPKGFSNSGVFKLWNDFFLTELSVRQITKPVVLLVHNSSTHIDLYPVTKCIEGGILLVALPANATHLFQPLDVTVFRPFKTKVREALHDKVTLTADGSISKADAIAIACAAFGETIIERPQNAVSGFSGVGLYPPNSEKLIKRLKHYASGGVKGDVGTAGWLKRRIVIQAEARVEVLTLPPEPQRTPKRQRATVDIAGRLVTKEMLDMKSRSKLNIKMPPILIFY
ncbi:hypothetical protein PC128_g20844 [Phytophthora cactorum]|nr:hypothetical protein PC128_g20844 [Phytophthora cactorum]